MSDSLFLDPRVVIGSWAIGETSHRIVKKGEKANMLEILSACHKAMLDCIADGVKDASVSYQLYNAETFEYTTVEFWRA